MQKSFVKGALILTLAGVLGKILGAVYRIPFNRIAGEEAAALYGLCYPLYTFLLALSTAGIPLAISKMVAEREQYNDSASSRRIFYLALGSLVTIGLVVALIVFFGANWIATNIFLEPRAALSLKALAPAMFFSCVVSVFRGYFQGLQQMIPTALSQICEQFVRVSVIFMAVFLLINQSSEKIAAGASFGAAVGTVFSFILMLCIFVWYRKKHSWSGISKMSESNLQIVNKVIMLAIPISIGALVLPIMQLIDAVLVIGRLTASGLSQDMALVQYGYLSSYAGPIINLPFIITTALAASLVPAVAQAMAANDKVRVNADLAQAMLLAVVVVLPASTGLMLLAEPICSLLYNKVQAGGALAWVAFAVLGVGVYQISSAALQGLGKVMVPMYNLLIGASIKVVLTYVLTSTFMGVRGAALSTVIAFSFAAILNVYKLCKIVGKDWLNVKRLVVKPIISVLVMAIVVEIVYLATRVILNSNNIAAAFAICAGGLSYFVVLLLIGTVDAEDIKKVPKIGNKLAKILQKK